MKEEVKEAFNKCLNMGATKEEFWTGRKAALAWATARKAKYAEDARKADEERIAHLMEFNCTRDKAKEQLRLEAFEAHDSMGGNPVVRIKRTPIPQVGLHIQAPKK